MVSPRGINRYWSYLNDVLFRPATIPVRPEKPVKVYNLKKKASHIKKKSDDPETTGNMLKKPG